MNRRVHVLGEKLRNRKRRSEWADPAPLPAADHPVPEAERSPRAEDQKDWADIGAVRPVPGGPLELPDSRAEPGGVPARVDPAMVNPATAERMKPLLDR